VSGREAPESGLPLKASIAAGAGAREALSNRANSTRSATGPRWHPSPPTPPSVVLAPAAGGRVSASLGRCLFMLRRLLYALSAAIVHAVTYSAVIGAPIAMLLLLAALHVRWWGATLERHIWLVIVLVTIIASHLVVGGILYESGRKHTPILLSPEGRRRRAEQIQRTIAAIIAGAGLQACGLRSRDATIQGVMAFRKESVFGTSIRQ
jgi:hypothetical protein